MIWNIFITLKSALVSLSSRSPPGMICHHYSFAFSQISIHVLMQYVVLFFLTSPLKLSYSKNNFFSFSIQFSEYIAHA